jgi:hypothetical protein
VANQGPYIHEEAQPRAILGTRGNNKTRDNSSLIIARDNGEGKNNSEPIRGELKHEMISPR